MNETKKLHRGRQANPSVLTSDSLSFKKIFSPGFGDLVLWDRCPRRLAVPLLFEFAAEGLLDVVHVEGTDRGARDAVEGTTGRGDIREGGRG